MQTSTRKPKLDPPTPTFSGTPLHSLSASQPGDHWEQDAQRMADRALGATGLQGIPGPSTAGETSGGPGQPLDPATRNFMEPRFNFNFGHVRLHTDTQAAQAADAVNARAFTFGNSIVFGAGQYTPHSTATRSLLVHELAHVVQQAGQQSGAPTGGMPAILRQTRDASTGGQPAIAPVAPGATLRQQYMQLACEVIAGIRRGIEEGRTWIFENEFLLQGDEWLAPPEESLIEERRESLQQLVRDLDEMIQLLEAGTLQPSQPANRINLRALWTQRYLGVPDMPNPIPRGEPARWSDPAGAERDSAGRLRSIFHSRGGYIEYLPTSPPGMLQPGNFPTWWVTGCQPAARPETPRTPQPGPVTPDRLGLSRDTVIFVGRSGGEITSWQWEPRNAPHPVALLTPYEWHYDESAGRVYIVVGGVRYNLFEHGRVERQP